MPQKLLTFGATERTWAMKMQLSGGLEPTKYYGRAKDARPSTRIASRWRGERRGEEDKMIASPTEATYFKAYPNPFSHEVTIEYDLKEDCTDGCSIRLVDIQGRIVFEQQIVAGEGPNRITFEMGRYEAGMYICSLYNNQRLLQTLRLVRIK